ncbi:hypothetical protein ACTMU2_33645 [Cupriavidus basilensis]
MPHPSLDPTAPIRFQPTISTTTGPGAPEGGVPVVGITTPNAAGISLNQYRALVVDPVGLILNNSTTGGGTFLGGQVAANPNLSGSGPANLIINQVTSSSCGADQRHCGGLWRACGARRCRARWRLHQWCRLYQSRLRSR